MAHHQRWRSTFKLQPSDIGVIDHEGACRALQVMASYDQLDMPNVASAELIARRLQLAEERHKDRLGGEGTASEDLHLYLGTDPTRGNLCVCPALSDWVGKELAAESAVMKERRKAKEERALARPKKEGK